MDGPSELPGMNSPSRGADNAIQPSAGSHPSPAVDVSELLRSVGQRRPLLRLLAETCLASDLAQVGALRGCLDAGDLSGLQLLAHRLKGNLGILRALRARDLAEALERAARSSDIERAGLALSELEDELSRVRDEMQALVSA